MSAPENPAAFPCEGEGFGNPKYSQLGMSLRDWFAGQALAGIMANPSLGDDAGPKYAYFLADEMLTERAKAGQP